VTKRRQADEQIRAALRENETLLREVHHRVKNNLAIIDNILELQASKLHEPLLVEVFRDCQNRIHSMVAIHDQLYRARDFGSLDFGAYAAELCSRLFQSYGVDPSRIRLQLDLAPVPLDLNRAVPLGLLLNELVSNTLKHAFPDGRRGAVTVRLRLESDGRVHFTVADDGIGFPPNLDLKQRHSLGLQLIQLLSRQVGGVIVFDRDRGTTVHLTFSHAPPGVYARDKREDETKSAPGRGRRASGSGALPPSGNDGI
jgi:two-component sensor histidine kinase